MARNEPETSIANDWETWIRSNPAFRPPASFNRRALLISYQFPPIGGSGVQRAAKLAKYLPQFGWSLEVLTAAHERFPWHDATLLADLPSDCQVHRVCGHEPACLARRAASGVSFAVPKARRWVEDRLYWRIAGWTARYGRGNGESWWVRPAVRAAIALHRRQPFDAVISTGPPHFAHTVARAVAARTRIPWIADLRDPLVSDFDRTAPETARSNADQQLEQRIARDASTIITTTQAFADDLQQRYPERCGNIHCITNGFDREDLAHASPAAATVQGKTRQCVLLASGAFYGRRELRRVLTPLHQTLSAHAEWDGRVQFVLAGTIDAEQRRELERDRPEWLSCIGYVSHAQAVQLAMQSDCSIVIVPECRHGRLSIPAKTFELIAAPRHVFGLVPPDSETESILNHAGSCTIAPLEDEQAVAAGFERIIAARFAGQLSADRDWNALDVYDRRNIAMQFAERLADACMRSDGSEISEPAAGGAELVLARLAPNEPEPDAPTNVTAEGATVEMT